MINLSQLKRNIKKVFYLKVIVLFHNWYPLGALLDSLLLVHTLENEDGVFLDRTIVGVSSLDMGKNCKSFPRGATKTGGDKARPTPVSAQKAPNIT